MISLRDSEDLHARARGYRAVAVGVVLAFALLAGRLWHLQVLRGESYYRKTADNFVKEVDLPASRGEIRDRRGRVLGENRPSYNVYLTPRFVTDEALAHLGKLLHLGDDQIALLKARSSNKVGLERYRQVLGVEDIGRDQMATIESERSHLPGIAVDARSHRSYPVGRTAAHVLGYMNQISGEELAAQREQGYHPGDYVGRAGVERQWESSLRGKDGFERVVIDAKGQKKTDIDPAEVARIIGGPLRQEPTAGDNIVLTLDLELQKIAERSLARYHSAAAVAVDVRSGRVLALASHPAFDPNVLTGRLTRAEDERLQSDPFRPMIDKAVREIYFPGSTFKIIPALAALQDRQVDLDEVMRCAGAYALPGHTFRCMEVHGRVALHQAIAESCNVFFYHLGERIGMDRMAEVARAFGFGAPTGIGLPGEAAGFIPTQEFHRQQGGFHIGFTLNTAIGQGATKVTVLQQALAYAALANGGDLWVPQLVERIETPAGRIVRQFDPRLRRHIEVAPEHLAEVRSALCDVVNDPRGTAWVARDPSLPVQVCGKTGTAQVRKNRKGEVAGWDVGNDHGWFAGFAPAEAPEIAIAALVEHGGLGGHVAAPVVMDIAAGYFRISGRTAAAPQPDSPPPHLVADKAPLRRRSTRATARASYSAGGGDRNGGSAARAADGEPPRAGWPQPASEAPPPREPKEP